MGGTRYSQSNRTFRAASAGYYTKLVDDIFEQNKKRQIHESMEPSKALIREARDSENHPHSVPIIIALDVTGSMDRIPHHMVRDGLPRLVSNVIERGIPDPQILFLAVGDAKCDSYPLQVGQFESGDEELDLWLTRTYLEGRGGGNGGESYSLAWYFASKHTVTDAWEKRNEKGFLFTIGDEPCHRTISAHEIKEIMGETIEASLSDVELLERAKQKYNVYHLHIMEGDRGEDSLRYWEDLLKENCIKVKDHTQIDKAIADIIVNNSKKHANQPQVIVDNTTVTSTAPKITL